LTRGCRYVHVPGLILGAMSLLGARSGSLTEAPAVSLPSLPVVGSRRKPAAKFSHRVHDARQ